MFTAVTYATLSILNSGKRYHSSFYSVVFLHKRNNQVPSHTTPFLLHYFVATCSGPSRPSSDHTGAVSEANLFIKLQLKIPRIGYYGVHEILS